MRVFSSFVFAKPRGTRLNDYRRILNGRFVAVRDVEFGFGMCLGALPRGIKDLLSCHGDFLPSASYRRMV